MISQFAPSALSRLIKPGTSLEIRHHGENLPIEWATVAPWKLEGKRENLVIGIEYLYHESYQALQWKISILNVGTTALTDLTIVPLMLQLQINPETDYPRVRHLTGSYHYDATYPPRAFRVLEERIMTHDHCKPVYIHSTRQTIDGSHMFAIAGSANEHVPILQFSIGPYGNMAGFYVGFEWSSAWHIVARWERDSYEGETRPNFLIEGNVGLTSIQLDPGETLHLPMIHLGFVEGEDWSAFDNTLKRYVREVLSCKILDKVPTPPVSYDHWFGIHQYFDVTDLKRQAERAAELGCENFCLDASWYRINRHWTDGIGNWLTPDPHKFPNGIRELSDHVHNLGMGFGLWHQLEYAKPNTDMRNQFPDLYDGDHLRLDRPEAREKALEILRFWITEWKVDWFRWESVAIENWAYESDPSGKLALAYTTGLYEVIDRLRAEFPSLYIEGCQGGGTKLDFGMVVRTHGTWLSDHTGNPDVCRFMQMGALRFWPSHLLNSAVRAHRKSGDRDVTAHNLLSRMVGTISFNGDITQWSAAATDLAKEYVASYKSIRHLLNEPIFFPLQQPASDRDWDIVLFGDDKSEARLLFAFRMEGPESIEIELPHYNWSRLCGSSSAGLETNVSRTSIHLEPNSSALWQS